MVSLVIFHKINFWVALWRHCESVMLSFKDFLSFSPWAIAQRYHVGLLTYWSGFNNWCCKARHPVTLGHLTSLQWSCPYSQASSRVEVMLDTSLFLLATCSGGSYKSKSAVQIAAKLFTGQANTLSWCIGYNWWRCFAPFYEWMIRHILHSL